MTPPKRSPAGVLIVLRVALGCAGAAAWYFWAQLAPLLGL
jgi:hypothetical protein